jgi:hypothetical protein
VFVAKPTNDAEDGEETEKLIKADRANELVDVICARFQFGTSQPVEVKVPGVVVL